MPLRNWPVILLLLACMVPVHGEKFASVMDSVDPSSEISRLCSSSSVPPEFAPSLVSIFIATSTKRGFAAYCLKKIGAPSGASLRAAWPRPMDSHARQGILSLAWEIDPTEKSFALVAQATRHPDYAVKGAAASLLGQMREKSDKAVPLLMELLQENPGGYVGGLVVNALTKIGEPAIPSLIARMRKGDLPKDSFGYFHGPESALSSIGAPAVPELLSVLRDGNQNAKRAAATSLRGIKPPSKDTLAEMRSLLGSEDPILRTFALEILGESKAAEVPDIEPLLRDPAWHVRADAAAALGKLGAKATASVPKIILLLDEPHPEEHNWNVQWVAIEALGLIGNPSAVDPLRRILREGDNDSSRYSAAVALGRIGAAAKTALPDLIRGLEDGAIREGCIDGLGRMGEHAKAAVPRLSDFLRNYEPNNCHQGTTLVMGRLPSFNCAYFATKALAKIGPSAAEAVPMLVAALEKRNGENLIRPKPKTDGRRSIYGGAAESDIDRLEALSALVIALEKIGSPEALAAAARNKHYKIVPSDEEQKERREMGIED